MFQLLILLSFYHWNWKPTLRPIPTTKKVQNNALHNVAVIILLTFLTKLVRGLKILLFWLLVSGLKILLFWLLVSGPEQLSPYSDLLQAGRCGDRIPVGAIFSAPVQIGRGPHPASWSTGTWSFPGVMRQERDVNQPPNLAPRLKKK